MKILKFSGLQGIAICKSLYASVSQVLQESAEGPPPLPSLEAPLVTVGGAAGLTTDR